jgi:oxaloacetate decarboxylase alpha subunit
LLGYRHYADDVVERFCDRAAENGVDVFRIFDAMNDPRNLATAIKAVKKTGKHAQGTIAYTTSPVHTIEMWVELAKEVADMGADSIAIKDMAGILKPYVAFDLVSRLKKELDIPIHMQCHATTGMSTATAIKAAEAGIDNVDTSISSMSMTYGHSPTEAVVAILEGTDRDTGLDLNLLEEIASYFREVRKKYARFEGSLRGTDSRILIAQVPGGMLTNMESQLKEQNASDKFDQVLAEIPKVREDLGFIPLVTPTSQIVGTQAVLNVLTGERYKSISKETAAILKGEYGAAPSAFNKELQERVLDGKEVITCRPADLIDPEMDKLTDELKKIAGEKNIKLAKNEIDDVLTYALFPQIGLKFLENRGNPDAFEPVPTAADAAASSLPAKKGGPETYTVEVNGKEYVVAVNEGGEISQIQGGDGSTSGGQQAAAPVGGGEPVPAPLGGNIFKVLVSPGDIVEEGDVMIILEAMKMETEVRAPKAGTIGEVFIKVGDAVSVDDEMLTIA